MFSIGCVPSFNSFWADDESKGKPYVSTFTD